MSKQSINLRLLFLSALILWGIFLFIYIKVTIPGEATQLTDINVIVDVEYSPLFNKWTIIGEPKVVMKPAEVTFLSILYRQPFGILTIDDAVVEVSFGDFKQKKGISVSRLGEKTSVIFDFKRVPQINYDGKIKILLNSQIKSEKDFKITVTP